MTESLTPWQVFLFSLWSPEVLIMAAAVVVIGRTAKSFWTTYVVAIIALNVVIGFVRPDFTVQHAIVSAGAILVWSGVGAFVRGEVLRRVGP